MPSEFRDTPQTLPPRFLSTSVTGIGVFKTSGLNGCHGEELSVVTVNQINGCLRFAGLCSLASCDDFCISLPLSYFLNPHNVRVPFSVCLLLPAAVWLSCPCLGLARRRSPFPKGRDRVSAEVSWAVRWLWLCFAAVTAVPVASMGDAPFRSRINHLDVDSGPSWNQTACDILPGRVGSLLPCILPYVLFILCSDSVRGLAEGKKKAAEVGKKELTHELSFLEWLCL